MSRFHTPFAGFEPPPHLAAAYRRKLLQQQSQLQQPGPAKPQPQPHSSVREALPEVSAPPSVRPPESVKGVVVRSPALLLPDPGSGSWGQPRAPGLHGRFREVAPPLPARRDLHGGLGLDPLNQLHRPALTLEWFRRVTKDRPELFTRGLVRDIVTTWKDGLRAWHQAQGHAVQDDAALEAEARRLLNAKPDLRPELVLPAASGAPLPQRPASVAVAPQAGAGIIPEQAGIDLPAPAEPAAVKDSPQTGQAADHHYYNRTLEHAGFSSLSDQLTDLENETELRHRSHERFRGTNGEGQTPIEADYQKKRTALIQRAREQAAAVGAIYKDWSAGRDMASWRTADDIPEELKRDALASGLPERDVRYWLQYFRLYDWAHPMPRRQFKDPITDAIGQGLTGAVGIDTQTDKHRFLPDGNLVINPLLHGDRAAYEKAVKEANAGPEAGRAAMDRFPALQREWARKVFDTLWNEPAIPFGLTFSQWWEKKRQGDSNQFFQLRPEDQLIQYVEEMRGRQGFAKYLDTVTRNFAAGGGDLISGALGLGGLVLGKVPGIGQAISETAAAWKGINDRTTGAIDLKGGADTAGLRFAGGIARMAPNAAAVIASGGALGGGTKVLMAIAGVDAAGTQYTDTYAKLLKEGVPHEEAWLQVAPWAVGTGIVSALTTGLGAGSGLESLLRNPNTLRQALQPVWKAVFKGAAAENAEELPTELISQIFAARAADKNADFTKLVAKVIGDFIHNAPQLIASVSLLGGFGEGKKAWSENRTAQSDSSTKKGQSGGAQSADQIIRRIAERTDATEISMSAPRDPAAKAAADANRNIREVQRSDIGAIETPEIPSPRYEGGAFRTKEAAVRQRIPEILQHGDHISTRPGQEGETEHIIAQPIVINGERLVATTVVRVRADGRQVAEAGMTKVYTSEDFKALMDGNVRGKVMSDHLVPLDDPIESNGGTEQRTALLNTINRAPNRLEAQGIIHAFHQMKGIGYKLVNVSLHYGSNQGLDLIFVKEGAPPAMVRTYAAVEAKNAGDLGSLPTDKTGLRQASYTYNQDRIEKYLLHGDGSQLSIAKLLLGESKATRLKSFVTFANNKRLVEISADWPNSSKPKE